MRQIREGFRSSYRSPGTGTGTKEEGESTAADEEVADDEDDNNSGPVKRGKRLRSKKRYARVVDDQRRERPGSLVVEGRELRDPALLRVGGVAGLTRSAGGPRPFEQETGDKEKDIRRIVVEEAQNVEGESEMCWRVRFATREEKGAARDLLVDVGALAACASREDLRERLTAAAGRLTHESSGSGDSEGFLRGVVDLIVERGAASGAGATAVGTAATTAATATPWAAVT